MSDKSAKKDKIKVEKSSKSEKRQGKEKKAKKKEEEEEEEKKQQTAASTFSLLADEKSVDSALSSLFAVKQPPVKPKIVSFTEQHDNDEELSEIDEEIDDGDDNNLEEENTEVARQIDIAAIANELEEAAAPKRKRKRKDADEELEDAYMTRLAREEEKDAERLASERAAKRQRQDAEKSQESDAVVEGDAPEPTSEADESAEDDNVNGEDDDSDTATPPKHETEIAKDVEVEKANRTVFLGNVSTAAISSKSSRKVLLAHLASFIEKLPPSKSGEKLKVESIRFRSTPYASAIPKKAAFAKKELMDATTKSTNAYVVYSTPALAREACQRLNGTVVLDRHLRVDSIAHPAKIDNRRCVFVGNLGFVDDESNIQEANEEDGREKRKRGKEPADMEEGLWRTFGKCGKVESVRVIRDSTTRVGKGIAYVQFEDENGVEAALLLNEKKFPPMLPRKLRVSRAKAPKKNAKAGSGRPVLRRGTGTGYQRKVTGEEASRMGRSAKLLGRAAAAKMRKNETGPSSRPARETGSASALGEGIKKPESFIFEGHRASSKGGKSGLKLGGKKSASRSNKITKRSSSFKKGGKKSSA